MKASGNYMGAGGSVDVSPSDYREQRTNWLFILVILAAVGAVLYYLLKSGVSAVVPNLGNIPKTIADSVTNAGAAVVDAAKNTQQRSVDLVVQTAGYTPGAAATEKYWDASNRWLGGGIVRASAVAAGNTLLSLPVVDIMGKPLLQTATVAGGDFGHSLVQYQDVDRLNADPLKGLIIGGEAISRTFTGISPYEAGKATSAWLRGIGL